jgi:hypothetical protein
LSALPELAFAYSEMQYNFVIKSHIIGKLDKNWYYQIVEEVSHA